MSEVIIRAENLGKRYVIGHEAENGRYVALRDVLMHSARSMWQKTKDLVRGDAIVQGDSVETDQLTGGLRRGASTLSV